MWFPSWKCRWSGVTVRFSYATLSGIDFYYQLLQAFKQELGKLYFVWVSFFYFTACLPHHWTVDLWPSVGVIITGGQHSHYLTAVDYLIFHAVTDTYCTNVRRAGNFKTNFTLLKLFWNCVKQSATDFPEAVKNLQCVCSCLECFCFNVVLFFIIILVVNQSTLLLWDEKFTTPESHILRDTALFLQLRPLCCERTFLGPESVCT